MSINSLIVIPARFKSTRLPGKPLRMIGDDTMLHRVYKRCSETQLDTVVATDDDRIISECKEKGMEWVKTLSEHKTGTDRVAEVAVNQLCGPYENYINVQGDEPFVLVEDILEINQWIMRKGQASPNSSSEISFPDQEEVICGMCPINDEEQYWSPNVPKIVLDYDHVSQTTNAAAKLRYISRAPIPGVKGGMPWPKDEAFKQVCIYGFKRWQLVFYSDYVKSWPVDDPHEGKSTIEYYEDIEILRFFDLGIDIRMVFLNGTPLAVDTEEDLIKANELHEKNPLI